MDDAFLEDVDFSSLRIDPINYEIPPSSLTCSSGEHKFSLPDWSSTPGEANGVVLHEIKEGKHIKILNLDKEGISYYLFGRSPKVPCAKGTPIAILHRNASRTHFAIIHSKFQSTYIIDLGSVHGTFIGKRKIQSYQPFQLENGNVISIGGCTFKFIVRIFPKKPGESAPFPGFTMGSEGLATFDDDTALHTHLNQVPEVLSPRGQHLVKPVSVRNIKTTNFTPVPLLTKMSGSNLKKHVTMFDLKNQSHIELKPTTESMNIEEEEVEQLDLSKPIQLNLPKRTNNAFGGGILKKAKSIHIKRIREQAGVGVSFRKVSFGDLKPTVPKVATQSNLRSSWSRPRGVSESSNESEEAVEIEDFDPSRDLPCIDLSVIESSSAANLEKSKMLRTYSVKEVRRHDNINFAFPSISDIRRRGEGFENASPLSRDGYIKRHRSERDLFSS